MIDVFNSDPFKVVPLTLALNNLEFVPGRIAELGLFSTAGVSETKIAIEEKNGLLALIPPTARGGPGTTLDKNKRNMRAVSIPHFEVNDAVMAEEVQGVRAFGTEDQLEMVMGKVAERGQIISQSFDATEEYSRIGAIKGVVTYADSSTLDLFSLFGVSQIAEVDFDLDNAAPASGALRKKCQGVARSIANEMEGIPYRGLHAFCGDAFFDDLLAHAEVRATYTGWSDAQILRDGYISPNGKSYGAFEFGGIIWENYRGSVGGTSFVLTDKCHIFPVGAPGLFRTWYAPADYNETVNTMGRRLYGKLYEMPNGKGYHFDMQTNPLNICTRPRVLQLGKRT
jgi:hypothetical protein